MCPYCLSWLGNALQTKLGRLMFLALWAKPGVLANSLGLEVRSLAESLELFGISLTDRGPGVSACYQTAK